MDSSAVPGLTLIVLITAQRSRRGWRGCCGSTSPDGRMGERLGQDDNCIGVAHNPVDFLRHRVACYGRYGLRFLAACNVCGT
jgi:hypothetical protein